MSFARASTPLWLLKRKDWHRSMPGQTIGTWGEPGMSDRYTPTTGVEPRLNWPNDPQSVFTRSVAGGKKIPPMNGMIGIFGTPLSFLSAR